jgi:hypothetical protein
MVKARNDTQQHATTRNNTQQHATTAGNNTQRYAMTTTHGKIILQSNIFHTDNFVLVSTGIISFAFFL